MGGVKRSVLDKRDIQILKELDINSRNSYRNIGRRIKKSKEFVRYRTQRLIEAGVIDSFITSIDYSKLGMYRVCLYIKFKEMKDELKHRIHTYKKSNHCRVKFFSVGQFDLFVDWILERKDNPNLIVHEFISMLGEHVLESSMNILYKIKHYRNRYLYGKQILEPFVSEYIVSDKVQISDAESQILKELTRDPRISIIDLAERCSLSPKTVISKMSNLKKLGVLTGFCIKLNNSHVNKEDFIILVKLNEKTENKKKIFEAYLDSINEVSYMGRLIGEFDFEFSITVNSQAEFIRILDKMRSDLKNDIKESTVLFLSPQ